MSATYEQIVKFLKALDKELRNPASLFIIGGGSITLAIDKQNRTVDLDAVGASREVLAKAGAQSKLAKEYGIYIQKVSEIGFAAPGDWRSKVKPITDIKLNQLKIFVAEIHDVILGKIARLEHRDFEDISDLMKIGVIDLHYLIQRLNQNKKELRKIEYRQNAIRLFSIVFNKNLVFKEGKAFVK